jgi:hypothetical protein
VGSSGSRRERFAMDGAHFWGPPWAAAACWRVAVSAVEWVVLGR